jgi:hypothetical protein
VHLNTAHLIANQIAMGMLAGLALGKRATNLGKGLEENLPVCVQGGDALCHPGAALRERRQRGPLAGDARANGNGVLHLEQRAFQNLPPPRQS